MRRVLAVVGVLMATTLVSSACSGSSRSAADKAAPAVAKANGGGDTSPGSTFTVCAEIRTALTADMKPLGAALGSVAGRTIAGDTDGHVDAVEQAATALKKIGADIAAAGAKATDPSLRTASAAAGAQVTTLAADSSFMANIKTIDDITRATAQLTQATTQVTSACQES